MKRIPVVVIGIYLYFNSVFCQPVVDSFTCDSFYKAKFETRLTGERLEVLPNLSGSQYYYDWDDADITLYSGEVLYNKKVRYNGYINEMIWLTPEKFINVKLDKSRIKEVYLKTNHITYRNLKIREYNNQKFTYDSIIFAEVLLDNKISMYAYRKIKQIGTDIIDKDSHRFYLKKIANTPVYYIKLPNYKAFVEIHKINKRTLIHLFPNNTGVVRKILRDHNLSVSSETDFARALKLIGNSIY